MTPYRLIKHLLRQRRRSRKIVVPDEPHFEPESFPYFMERLARSSEYLEYGSGGSTVEAARLSKKFTSVESDKYFYNSVVKKIGAKAGRLIHVDIGFTEDWGAPVFKELTERRLRRWKRYASAPWDAGINPDFILIDGRFRVYCALYTLNQLKGRDFELLVDDYTDRPQYHAVEKFAELKDCKGRMACFGPKNFSQSDMNTELVRYRSDWR